MKKLLIKQCPDGHRWYSGLVGQCVDYLGDDYECYKSRELEGYINFVRKEDAYIVDVEESQQEHENKNTEPFGYVLEYFPGKYFNEFHVNPFNAKEMADLFDEKVISIYDHTPMQKNLIDAAPDMYEALKACHEAMVYMSEYDIPITLADQVRDALEKADGEVK